MAVPLCRTDSQRGGEEKRVGLGWDTGGLGSNGGGKPQKNNMFAISEVLLKAKIARDGNVIMFHKKTSKQEEML